MGSRTIGQLAQEAGVPVETVRYYERIGLLEQPKRELRGWRRYPEESLTTLRYIRVGRAVGFSLHELGDLLSLATKGAPRFCVAFDAAVNDKIKAIDRLIAELNTRRSQLAGFSEECRQRRLEGHCPILENLGLRNGSSTKQRSLHVTTGITGTPDPNDSRRQRSAKRVLRRRAR